MKAHPPSSSGGDGPPARWVWRWVGFALLTALCLALFVLLPASASVGLFVLFSAGLWAWAVPQTRHGLIRLGSALDQAVQRAIRRRRAAPLILLRDFGLICILLVLGLMWAARQYLTLALTGGLIGLIGAILAAQTHPVLPRRAGAALIRAARCFATNLRTASTPPAQPVEHRPPRGLRALLYAAEIALVLGVAWHITAELRVAAPDMRLYGKEAEYLTASAYSAAYDLHTYGYIALWQPWLEHGEPLITGPFSFVLNPISTVPSLLTDGLRGIKLSVVAYALFAGLGGWFLGRVLGLGTVGRVLLGLLMAGRGSMHAPLSAGFFQLATSQAYMPWIVAGTVATLRDHTQRWPPVLLAVMLTLLLWAGNLWYTLPMLVTVGLLALLYVVRRQDGSTLDWRAIRRLALAAGLTLGLAAITLFPLWATRRYVLHPEEIGAGPRVALSTILRFYVRPDGDGSLLAGGLGTYYAYVVPVWFLLLLFVYIPPVLPPLFSHPARAGQWRIWLAGLILIALATLWGMGDTAPFRWLYAHVTLLREWRFVGRALAVGAFWIAVLVALRADALVQCIAHPVWRRPGRALALIQAALIVALGWAAWRAAGQVTAQYGRLGLTHHVSANDDTCVSWLRAEYPGAPLSAYRADYDAVYPFLQNEVRLFNIEVAYHAQPRPSLFPFLDLRPALPQYAIVWLDDTRTYLIGRDFQPVPDSPTPVNDQPCAYEQLNAYPYAFAARANYAPEAIYPNTVSAVPVVDRKPDVIALRVDGDAEESVIVVVDELAFPGWQGRVDGQRARVESIGGLIGVILPPGRVTHTVVFRFRPTLFVRSAWITLLTIAGVVLYLLRAERWLPRIRRR